MSDFRSIHWSKDEWENLVINIYNEPQLNEDKNTRKDWREICHISVSSYKELNTIMKFIKQFDIIEINGGQRVVIPSTEESKLNEWQALTDELLDKNILKRVNPSLF